jgi:hypothetical protein
MKFGKITQKIKEKIRTGKVEIRKHAYEQMDEDFFTVEDLFFALQNFETVAKLTDDETHIRYELVGFTEDKRAMLIVVFFSQSDLQIKTVFEIFDVTFQDE